MEMAGNCSIARLSLRIVDHEPARRHRGELVTVLHARCPLQHLRRPRLV